MKRMLVSMVLVSFLLLGAAGAATADVRLDVDVPVILSAGLSVSTLTDSSTVNVDLSKLHIPLPCVELAYQFGDGDLRGGLGVRAYTVLIEFVGWPMGYVELEMDKVVLRGELGFGLFALGLANGVLTTNLVESDIQLGYAVTPWLRVGAGLLVAVPPSDFSNNGWMIYVNARFAFDFK